MSFRLSRLPEADGDKENEGDGDGDLWTGDDGANVSPPPLLNKTGSGPLWPTSEAKQARRQVSIKQRHESKSTNDVRSFGHDVKAKHQLLVLTKAECVAELALFLPTLSHTADALAAGADLEHREVGHFQIGSFFFC